MSTIGAVDSILPSVLNVNQYAIVETFIVLSILHALDVSSYPLIVHLTKNVSARKGYYFGAFFETDRASGCDTEYLPSVIVAGDSFLITEDVGFGVVHEVAGRAFHGAVLGCRRQGSG